MNYEENLERLVNDPLYKQYIVSSRIRAVIGIAAALGFGILCAKSVMVWIFLALILLFVYFIVGTFKAPKRIEYCTVTHLRIQYDKHRRPTVVDYTVDINGEKVNTTALLRFLHKKADIIKGDKVLLFSSNNGTYILK